MTPPTPQTESQPASRFRKIVTGGSRNSTPGISRRNFLKTSAAAASGPLVAGLAVERAVFAAGDTTKIATCPAPVGESMSADYRVTVGGKPVPVYTARVSAIPLNHIWPGFPCIRCERPIEQTEIASFACWDMSGPAEVEVVSNRPVRTVAIRPAARGIKPVVEGNRVSFTMPGPGYLTVEVNGFARALHLFASPLESDPPKPDAPGVRYFGPGIHRPGVMHLRSGETLYIAAGAVVHGAVLADDASDVKILGRGILDVSTLKRGQTPGAISLAGCRNARIEGIVIRDVNRWAVVPAACRGVVISGLKLIGFWRYNADGINVVNSQDVVIEKCFIRSFDDSITIKGVDRKHHRFTELGRGHALDELPVRNVKVSRCVIWNDWGTALNFGAESSAPEITDVVCEDCDIIRTASAAIGFHIAGFADVHNIRFERIRLETHDDAPWPVVQKSRDEKYQPKRGFCPCLLSMVIEKSYWGFTDKETRGKIRDIVLKDVFVTGGPSPKSVLRGYDDEHCVENVTIENLRINGALIPDPATGGFTIGAHVKNVKFR